MDLFLLRIIIAGIGISLCASSIGSFILWKQMSYFGDSLSHSILLGIVLGICINILPVFSMIAFSVIIILIMNFFDKKYSKDSILGIVSQSCLALTMIINSFYKKSQMNLEQYLFGDILIVSNIDIYIIYFILFITIFWLSIRWNSLILSIISEDLAHSNNINVERIKLELNIFIAIVIAISIKIVGTLLINALLIIPATSARTVSSSPKQMIIYSYIFGSISTSCGIIFSNFIDIPTGPTIIISNLICLLIIYSFSNFKNYFKNK